MTKVRAGIIGAAGYTGGELLRLLLLHPSVELAFIHSKSQAGKPVWEVHADLFGDTNLRFTGEVQQDVDVIFLCVAHGDARKFLAGRPFGTSVKIIDLSRDFRIAGPEHGFVYGLPELNRQAIVKASRVANPGCFATAIQLALLPLAQHRVLSSDVVASCTTGSTGAGQTLSETAHFSRRQGNQSVYKPFVHEHLAEINQSLRQLHPEYRAQVVMIPQRGSFTRGIIACLSLRTGEPQESLERLYDAYYQDHPFVYRSSKAIDLKQVINTNKCLVHLQKHEDQLLIVSVIDNLLKGASGQALQNMNLMFGLPENAGLQLKPSAF